MRPSARRSRIVLSLSILLFAPFALAGSAVAQWVTATHLPLVEGQVWEFLENDTFTVTKEVLADRDEVNGFDAFVVETVGGEVGFGRERFTNDAFGLQFHRVSDTFGQATFTPPVLMLPDQFDTGDMFSSSGNVVSDGGFMIPYTSSTTVVGPATIVVPAGTFDTVVVEVTLTINNRSTTDRLFFADGVGVVRGEANIETPGGITELVSVPEPGFAQAALSIFALAGWWARRRG